MCLNTYFQFLNNITRIFTHLLIHLYFLFFKCELLSHERCKIIYLLKREKLYHFSTALSFFFLIPHLHLCIFFLFSPSPSPSQLLQALQHPILCITSHHHHVNLAHKNKNHKNFATTNNRVLITSSNPVKRNYEFENFPFL